MYVCCVEEYMLSKILERPLKNYCFVERCPPVDIQATESSSRRERRGAQASRSPSRIFQLPRPS